MNISEVGIEQIKRYESLSLTVYDDQAGLPTIGYGHLIVEGDGFTSDTVLTPAEATDLFHRDLSPMVQAVNHGLIVDVTQAQFDALVSFVFNCGIMAFYTSSLRRAINIKAPNKDIRERLMRWNRVTVKGVKVESKGLTARRMSEAKAWPL